MQSMQSVCVLGATGSIGQSTLDVLARHPQRFSVFALSAHRQIDVLLGLCQRFSPQFAVASDPASYLQLREGLAALGLSTQALAGPQALCEVASSAEVDCVMAAIVGSAGLPSSLAAARAGKKVLLANKESLVMSGALFMDAVAAHGAVLLPIDSEHNAVFQALPLGYAREPRACGVRRILLTASGGPFRTRALDTLAGITPDQACAHPNWSMGRKISVDSATMMNKGLEVIEAHWLFGVSADAIEVVIHPQSVIHSLVDYVDGSVLAQLGNPDMRTPIAHALAYPERIDAGVAPLDLCAIARLDFESPDLERFPCLSLAYQALRAGGGAATVLNAANELAVEAFLAGRLRFDQIAIVIAEVLESTPAGSVKNLEEVLALDAEARRMSSQRMARL